MQFKTADEILDFAIKNEEEAVEFYTNLATMTNSQSMKKVLKEFADEERKHKERLIVVKKENKLNPVGEKIEDLKVGDYLVVKDPDESNFTYQDALVLAMKKEKAAFKLYTDLANMVQDSSLKEVLLSLAQEEAKHKLKFEIEYDENILHEN